MVDAGKVVQAEEINSPVANFSSISYVGDAPDIGAYEYGDSHYWIPGRREEQATFPIPAHEATQIETQQDLLFRNAYLSTKLYTNVNQKTILHFPLEIAKYK